MTSYFGDFAEDDTVLIPFNTFDSNDPQASVTITNLADADIMVHKDGGLTQIATDGATVVIDFDSITGNHMITIDTSAHADYSTGSEYAVRIEGTTVDAGTINAWVGSFSIERAGGALAIAKLIQAAVITNAAGTDIAADIIAVKAETALIVADTNELQTDDVPGLIATAQADLDTITDTDGVIVGAAGVDLIWDEVLTGASHNVTNSAGKRLRQIDAAFEVHSGTAQAGAATTITLDTGASATNDIYRGDRIMIVGGTGIGEHDICISYNGTTKVATMAETWVITPDATSEFILVPASVDVETWQHSVVTGDGDWAGMVGATFSTSTDSLEAIRDRGDAAWTTGAGGSPPTTLQNTTIATLASQVSFTLTAGSADDDAYNGMMAVVTDSATSTQKCIGKVSDYTGSTKTVTLAADPGVFTMAVGDTIDIVAVTDRIALVDVCTTNTDMVSNSDITKNATFSNFEFPMVLTSDHYTAATSKSVTGEMSIDGAAFAATNGTIAEVGSGVYQIDLTADDTNGDVITYKFSATSCDDTIITVTTKV